MIKRTLWFFVFALMAISCLDQPDCYSLNNNIVGIGFKKIGNGASDTVLFKNITAEGLNEALFNQVVVTGVDLQLNLYRDSTTFYFEGPDKIYDLTLRYSVKAQFVSEDCGERFVISGLRAFSETFDSVRVRATTPKARDITGTNIEVFSCPDPGRVKMKVNSGPDIKSIEANFPVTIPIGPPNVRILRLPLIPASNQTIFYFTFTNEAKRFIEVKYDRKKEILFDMCGEQVILTNIAIVDTDFDKRKVNRATTENPNLINIEVDR